MHQINLVHLISGVEGHYFLTDVIFIESCNYTTFSQAILGSLHRNNLDFHDVWAVVTNNASYCLKAYKEVLKGVMPTVTANIRHSSQTSVKH